MFRGREIVYTDKGRAILDRLVGDVEELGYPEVKPKLEGHRMTMILAPKKT
ncbi:hypothetical protein ACFLU6_13155 [Acidobacteriota bacterium]